MCLQEFVERGAAMAVGASLRHPMEWQAITWKQAHRNVRRLQVRLVKALKAGRKEPQGTSLAVHSDELAQWQSRRHETSDDQPRQTDSGRGQRGVGHPGEEDKRHRRSAPSKRPPTTFETSRHSQE